MARTINKLSPVAISKATTPGLYGDGVGLYLQVSKSGTRSWIFRYMLNGKAREMGLGPLHDVSLKDARFKAQEWRNKIREQGMDPIEVRRAGKLESRLRQDKAVSFEECAKTYIETHKASWKNKKHVGQWENTLRDYVYPIIGDMPVSVVDTDQVMKCLTSIWTVKTETATRVRGRIEKILDWATTSKYRTGENPARWRGHLVNLLPLPSRIKTVKHHASLPHEQIHDFMAMLKNQEGLSAMALKFAILTAARTNEVIGATWDEISVQKKIWTIPASRMKAKQEHRVPLSEHALTILKDIKEQFGSSGYVFKGERKNKHLSNMALAMALRRLERTDITTHGFRSTFREWAAEKTAYPREVAEMALAHTKKDKVEAAYWRGDLFDKRIRMMEEWARYCETSEGQGQVIPISSTRPKHKTGDIP